MPEQVPVHAEKWMSHHIASLHDRELSKICMPGSHDAGMWFTGKHTDFGTTDVTKTQSRSIPMQLRFGARWFDIRPTLLYLPKDGSATVLAPEEWACGHFTYTTPDLKYQGAVGQTIASVVDDINTFLECSDELVILSVTQTRAISIRDPPGISLYKGNNTGNYATPTQLDNLWSVLSGLKHRFTLADAREICQRRDFKSRLAAESKKRVDDLVGIYSRDKSRTTGMIAKYRRDMETLFARWEREEPEKIARFDWYLLRDFIGEPGSTRGRVLVLSEYNDIETLFPRDVWPIAQYEFNNFDGVTRMQDAVEAVSSALLGTKSNSILELTAKHQAEVFPWLLQHVFAEKPNCGLLTIDDIKDDRIITLCLAWTFIQRSLDLGYGIPTIIYGGKVFTDDKVRKKICDSIISMGRIQITNELFGDPWENSRKSCAVIYRESGVLKSRWVLEGEWMNFSPDILRIEYGGVEIKKQKAYNNLLWALLNKGSIKADNGNLDGDPTPNVYKSCTVKFRRQDKETSDTITAKEGNMLDFSSNLAPLGWGAGRFW